MMHLMTAQQSDECWTARIGLWAPTVKLIHTGQTVNLSYGCIMTHQNAAL